MSNRAKVIAGVVLVGIGLLFALLPKEWIEETFGFEPDGGNGMVELALVLIPIALGAAFVVAATLGRNVTNRATARRADRDA